MSKRLDEYLENFFEEKDLGDKLYKIEHKQDTHFIGTDIVIDLIKNSSYSEKQTIINTLRQIDFKNGDVHHYLEFLAGAYVKTNY